MGGRVPGMSGLMAPGPRHASCRTTGGPCEQPARGSRSLPPFRCSRWRARATTRPAKPTRTATRRSTASTVSASSAVTPPIARRGTGMYSREMHPVAAIVSTNAECPRDRYASTSSAKRAARTSIARHQRSAIRAPARMPKRCVSRSDCGEGEDCVAGLCAPGHAGNAPPPCELPAVLFDFNEATLTTEATGRLATAVDCLKSRDALVRAVGHADHGAPKSTTSRFPSGAPAPFGTSWNGWVSTRARSICSLGVRSTPRAPTKPAGRTDRSVELTWQ